MTDKKNTTTNKNDVLYHELKKMSSGKRELHIWAYGVDLTKGQRTLTSKVQEEIDEDEAFFALLNVKAKELFDNDFNWSIDTLSDWRSWAVSYRNEFLEEDEQRMARNIQEAKRRALIEQGLIEA